METHAWPLQSRPGSHLKSWIMKIISHRKRNRLGLRNGHLNYGMTRIRKSQIRDRRKLYFFLLRVAAGISRLQRHPSFSQHPEPHAHGTNSSESEGYFSALRAFQGTTTTPRGCLRAPPAPEDTARSAVIILYFYRQYNNSESSLAFSLNTDQIVFQTG